MQPLSLRNTSDIRRRAARFAVGTWLAGPLAPGPLPARTGRADNAGMLSPRPTPCICARSRRPAWLLRATAAAALAALALGMLCACSPALDWRLAGPRHVDILLQYPCRPRTLTQEVHLLGRPLRMSMTGCVAEGMTFALAHVDVGDPALVGPALAALHQAALSNISAQVLRARPSAVKHARSGLPDALELDLRGHAPGAPSLREHVLLFARGTGVFQATVLAAAADYRDQAARTFAASVQLGPRGN